MIDIFSTIKACFFAQAQSRIQNQYCVQNKYHTQKKRRALTALATLTCCFLALGSLAAHADGNAENNTKKASSKEQAANEKVEVVLKTDLGKIVVELHPEKAPKTVENFLHYVNTGFYNGVIFHRVIPNFMAQTGGFTDKFARKATQGTVVNESVGGLPNLKGTLSMARTIHPDSASSQFFINVINNPHLNARGNQPGYTVFGTVKEGLEHVIAMTELAQGAHRGFPNAPNLPIHIIKAYTTSKPKIEKPKMDISPQKISPPKPPSGLQGQ